MIGHVDPAEISAYYDAKTQALLHRYGPGPRIHYHAGITDGVVTGEVSEVSIRREVVASQERILERAAESWDAATWLSGSILDGGCGLGGGSLFWAQEFGATVDAVTLATNHVDVVHSLARDAGVGDRVSCRVGDVTRVTSDRPYDAAVFFESSCHMSRERLFETLAGLLPSGRPVFISDFFYVAEEYQELWGSYWLAPLGSLAEYRAAATAAGFVERDYVDVSTETHAFWQLTADLVDLEAQVSGILDDEAGREKVARSRAAHLKVQEGLLNGGLQHGFLSFERS